MRVSVYRNLHVDRWSVLSMDRADRYGKVIERTEQTVIKDPLFVVQRAGRARVLRESRKNVHAFVRGEQANTATVDRGDERWKRVSYNPYKRGQFVLASTGEPVKRAAWAHCNTVGQVWVLGAD